MKLSQLAQNILLGKNLEDKTIDFSSIEFDDFDCLEVPTRPGRSAQIAMSSKNAKFPKGHFNLDEKKAMALNSFANHELLAVEMMACALLIYPHHTPELKQFKKGILSTLKDEQKHLKLYVQRLNELGFEFGDFVLNDYFWRQMKLLKTPAQYLSVMALTFEAANLDFAFHYQQEFKKVDDFKTSEILGTVLKEEISHVSFGALYLNRLKGDKSLIEYYQSNLPGNLTPARSKGQFFQASLRERAKLDQEFISWIQSYQDDFTVTQRKEWK
ncbi:MAG: hypothetical protein CME62_13125 [Halobacteriovoraceae bacterium]|nr:hypothetical protein [Halobacteriovoraceae bacterium]|tara:strand:+ start:16897 stop:17709 length:813 start_codon:yes stop_codon:yes gene_type:complete